MQFCDIQMDKNIVPLKFNNLILFHLKGTEIHTYAGIFHPLLSPMPTVTRAEPDSNQELRMQSEHAASKGVQSEVEHGSLKQHINALTNAFSIQSHLSNKDGSSDTEETNDFTQEAKQSKEPELHYRRTNIHPKQGKN